jgi:hypothetical protein
VRFRDLATLRGDIPLFNDVDELRWRGPTAAFADVCTFLDAPELRERADHAAALIASS